MNPLRRLLPTITLLLAALACSAARADTLDTVLAAKLMRVATNPDYPPYGYTSKDQKLIGYDTEVAELIAKALGVRLELVAASAPNRIPYLQTKKVDLVIASLGITPERRQVIDFSAPYGGFFSGIYGPKSMSITKAEDLAGKTVATIRGTPPDIELSRIAPASVLVVRYDDNNLLATAYMTGQVPLIASSMNITDLIGTRMPEGKPDLKIAFTALPIGIGITKGDVRTKERIDAILGAHRGELDALSKKWFGFALPEFKQP